MGAIKEPTGSLYETDFAAWAQQQADALRERRFDDLDNENLIEEIESMGRQQRAALRRHLVVLLTHLLKLDAQPLLVFHHRSWELTIIEQRRELADHLDENPSLLSYLPAAMAKAFAAARVRAARESG